MGLLGAGFLAVPLTRRLLTTLPRGTHVAAFNREPDMLAAQQQLGAARAASPADLAARSEVVFVLLDNLDQLEAQLTGPSGLEAGVHSPTVAVVTTALAPERLRSLAHRVAERTAGRLRLIDAPLSGPQSAVLSGELSIAVGVASSAYPEIEPLLSLLGPCLRVGGVGSGQVAHACEQLLVAAAAVGLSEAILVAERSGMDISGLLANWRKAGVTTRLLDAAQDQRRSRETEHDHPASLLAGPLGVAAAEADRVGVRARMLAELRDLGERLELAGLGHHDLSAGYRAWAAQQGRPGSPTTSSAANTGAA